MMRTFALAALALLAGCSKPAPDPANAEGYTMTMTVKPSAGDGVQRIELPPRAVAALQRDDAGDLRIFDGQNRPLSLALANTASKPAGLRSIALDATPIAVAKPKDKAAVSVRVDQAEQSVTVDAVNQEAEAENRPEAALLFDTRRLNDPVLALELDAKIEKGQMVEVAVAASGDLKIWEPLASKVLLGTDGNPDLRIAMPGLALTDRYVRVSWQLTEGAAIRGAKAIVADIPPPSPMIFATSGVRLENDHQLRFKVPLGVTLIGIRVTGQSGEGVVPLTLTGRNSPEAPWQPLAQGALRNGSSAQLDFPTAKFDEYRITADPRSPGFATKPRIELLTAPIVVLAAFNGQPPYTLALGNAAAPSSYLERRELLGRPRSDASLPEAKVRPTAAPVLALSAPDDLAGFSPRKALLWAALLAATAVLALAAFKLLKGSRTQAAEMGTESGD